MYDCIIIGGGIAGLQAAIQLGRYEHKVLVIDRGYGRSTLCRSYHNILGWPDGISGVKLRKLGKHQAQQLGMHFQTDEVIRVHGGNKQFTVQGKSNQLFYCRTILLATGLLDRFPTLPGLKACLGRTIYVCPDCDGWEVKNKSTVVIGSGNVGAQMALTLSYWTKKLTYINHEQTDIGKLQRKKLEEHGIVHMPKIVKEIVTKGDGRLSAILLESGNKLRAERGFIAFGGNEVESRLAKQLGVERLENKHILTDPRSKMTNVPHVWAIGDVAVHSEQVTIAMGEGTQAAIWIHKALMQLVMNKKQTDVNNKVGSQNSVSKGGCHMTDKKKTEEQMETKQEFKTTDSQPGSKDDAVEAITQIMHDRDQDQDNC